MSRQVLFGPLMVSTSVGSVGFDTSTIAVPWVVSISAYSRPDGEV